MSNFNTNIIYGEVSSVSHTQAHKKRTKNIFIAPKGRPNRKYVRNKTAPNTVSKKEVELELATAKEIEDDLKEIAISTPVDENTTEVNVKDTRYDVRELFNIEEMNDLVSVYESEFTVTAGMIGHSHEFPVMECIFPERLSQDQIFDFDYHNKVIDAFFKSKPKTIKELNLYASGLQTVLCSIVRYCQKNKISLNVFHYDQVASGRYSYIEQQVLSYANRPKKVICRETVSNVADHYMYTYTYKTKLTELKENDECYVLKITHPSLFNETRTIYDSCIIINDFDVMMDLYTKILKSMMFNPSDKHVSILLDGYKMIKENDIIKISNTPIKIGSSRNI